MLPLARYRLHWRATRPIHFPAYAGSMLRGAFGHALRRLACMTRQKECSGCPLLASCPYPAIFAPPPRQHSLQSFSQIPAPYLIEPPAWGERTLAPGDAWDFSLVLFGRALRELPLITLAFRQALQRGIGPGDGQSELVAITCETQSDEAVTIYHAGNGRFTPHETACPKPGDDDIDEVTLHLLTPLRLQENGRALPPRRLGAPALLMAATRRASLLAEFHGAGAPGWNFTQLRQIAATIADHKQLEWKDWTRRSARQQQTMQLGGVVGAWTLRGNLTPFMPALHIGQWLHVGKETVFGLGHYRLEHKYAPRSQTPEGSPQVHETTKQNAVPQ
jgi:hypothetical protein